MRYPKSGIQVTSFLVLSLLVSAKLVYAEHNQSTYRYQGVDQNKDNQITQEEWNARQAKSFSNQDLNHDGVISADELKVYHNQYDNRRPYQPNWQNQGTPWNDHPAASTPYDNGWRSNAERHYATFDSDRNGIVSRGEWQGAQGTFDRLDANHDGNLSRTEFFSYPDVWATGTSSPAAYPAFSQGLDRNRDGVISRREWRGSEAFFRKQDRNNDGVLSKKELEWWAKHKKNRGSYQRDNWNYNSSGPSAYGSGWQEYAEKHFREFNTNGDGVVSRGEWQGSGETFDRFDGNRDGVLTRTEFFSRSEIWIQQRNDSLNGRPETTNTASTSSDDAGGSGIEQLLLQFLGSQQ